MEHSGNDDVSYVDMTLVFLISASSQVGILLDEILVTGTRQGRSIVKFATTSCVSQPTLFGV